VENIVCLKSGSKISLKKVLGQGGSAIIYLTSKDGYIAKIYHKSFINENTESRLKIMVREFKTNHITTSMSWEGGYTQQIFTWPEELLYYPNGLFAGFLRKDVGGNDHVIESTWIVKNHYYGKENWKGFSKIKNKFILAQRLAVVFSHFYKSGNYQNGDIKPQNIMIDINGYPIIIDMDNLSVRKSNRWLVPKGKMYTENYRAPDWSSKNVSADYFTIAIVFYELLFGLHPYDGTTQKNGETRQEAIDRGLYVHGPNKNLYTSIADEHKAVLLLPKDLQMLFYKAFSGSTELRPKPIEWADVLLNNITNGSIPFNEVERQLKPKQQTNTNTVSSPQLSTPISDSNPIFGFLILLFVLASMFLFVDQVLEMGTPLKQSIEEKEEILHQKIEVIKEKTPEKTINKIDLNSSSKTSLKKKKKLPTYSNKYTVNLYANKDGELKLERKLDKNSKIELLGQSIHNNKIVYKVKLTNGKIYYLKDMEYVTKN
jgi:serine/threonine protein kinase